MNLINRASKNSFDENLIYIWLLIKKSINDSLQLELKSYIDVKNILEC